MKRLIAVIAAIAALLAIGALSAVAASPKSTATFQFALSTTGGFHPSCRLTITSSKDISNYTVNGVKTEGVDTPRVTINVASGDVITVKAGTSTASYTVTGCVPADDHDVDDHHGGDDHHDGHDHHEGDDGHDGHQPADGHL
jgi:ABC-type glycerol-3-phosphate transport system substrate-binding protein